jgi:hypothetical protein
VNVAEGIPDGDGVVNVMSVPTLPTAHPMLLAKETEFKS